MSSPRRFKTSEDALVAANTALQNVAPRLVPGVDAGIDDWKPEPDDERVANLKAKLMQRMRNQFAGPAGTGE